jgi:hypothetical protein
MEEERRGRGKSEIRVSKSAIPSSVSRWAPVLVWMAGIFYFSSRPDPLGFLPLAKQQESIGKAAHFAECAGLAVLLYRALSGDQQVARDTEHPVQGNPHPPRSDPPPGRRAFALSFAMALTYAALDELHQNSVPGRGGELVDIGYDMLGMTAALGMVWMMRERGRWR